jgi:hypothetical protein
MITIPRGGQKCFGNHTWQFDSGKYDTDADGWLNGPAHCTKCEEITYLWLWPRLGPLPDLTDAVHGNTVVQNLFGVGYHRPGGKGKAK